ncbi:hypothetical protein HRbin40_01994 [bacterium HR40]|nr:hypothetical protein HRbin40_01994 [bacterium HR40]
MRTFRLLPLALAAATPATAVALPLDRVERFAAEAAAICPRAPAPRCLDTTFAFLDADRDRRVTAAELDHAAAAGDAWLARHGDRLGPSERGALAGLLATVRMLGPETVIEAYDRDGDRALRQAELFADIRADRRPLPELLRDPEGVDWPAARRRFGFAVELLRGLLIALPTSRRVD